MVRWMLLNIGFLAVALFSSGCGIIWGSVTWLNHDPVLNSLTYSCNYKGFLIGTAVSGYSPVSGTNSNYSISPALPTGLTLNSATGIISGTPTGPSPLTAYTVSAKSSTGATVTATINIQTDSGYLVNDLVHDSDWASGGCVSGVGTCTIRAAIDSATPPNLIILPAGTTTLTLGAAMTVAQGTSIYGDCASGTTIDGNNSVQIFLVNSGPTNFYNVTLQHGSFAGDGGAAIDISSAQVGIFDSSFFSNNATGGVGDGGAINIWGPLNLTVVGSTFYNNSANIAGGAISNSGSGSTILINDTFNGNTANQGAVLYGGNYNITNSTFTNNITSGCCTAAIAVGVNTLNFSNNLFYNNTGGLAENCYSFGGTTFNSLGNNLTDNNGTDCNFGGSDYLNTPALLGPLQNNGGLTLTNALLTGSPGIDQGNTTACSTTDSGVDQRGYPRLVDGKCDIGAYESSP